MENLIKFGALGAFLGVLGVGAILFMRGSRWRAGPISMALRRRLQYLEPREGPGLVRWQGRCEVRFTWDGGFAWRTSSADQDVPAFGLLSPPPTWVAVLNQVDIARTVEALGAGTLAIEGGTLVYRSDVAATAARHIYAAELLALLS